MNIFKDKETMPSEAPETGSYGMPASTIDEPKRARCCDPVEVTMTPAQNRALTLSNYPRYDAMDVNHTQRPKYGHHY